MDNKPPENSDAAIDEFFADWVARMERWYRERRAREPPKRSGPHIP